MSKKKPKITAKLMHKFKKNCGNCAHFKEVETDNSSDSIGMCYAFFREGQVARGARSEAKYCGKHGSKFLDKKNKPSRRFLPLEEEEPKLIEDMTLEELDEIVIDGLDPNDKRRITNRRKKLNKEQ